MAEWTFFLFLHLFLLFLLPQSSHQITINAIQLDLTFVHKDDFNTSDPSSRHMRRWIEILEVRKWYSSFGNTILQQVGARLNELQGHLWKASPISSINLTLDE